MPDGSELAVDTAIEACAAGWTDTAARTRAAAQLGLVIDDTTASRLVIHLAAANEQRRLYTLPLTDLLRAIVDAREAGIGLRHGGKGGKFAMTPCSVALAVREGMFVHVALGTAPARSPSPGSIWKRLAPWHQDLTKNLVRAQHWARTELMKTSFPVIERAAFELRQSLVTRDVVLAEVLARPREDGPRLIYADTLIAHGDPRGEFIVVQCALAAGSTDPKLVKLELALRRKHGASWLRDAKQLARHAELRRGFVGSITMTGRQFEKAAKLFTQEPVEELVIVDPTPKGLSSLAALPHLHRLDRITIADRTWIADGTAVDLVRDFLRALPNLRSFRLHATFGALADARIHELFDGVAWPRIEELELSILGAGIQGRRNIPVVTADWICTQVWGSLCGAQIPKLKELAIAPFGHDRELAAAFPAATIRPL